MYTDIVTIDDNERRIKKHIDGHIGCDFDIVRWKRICEDAFDLALPFMDDRMMALVDGKLARIFSPYKETICFSKKDYERLQQAIQDSVPEILREIYLE